jgi:Kef-type K+ transport system membrane component KefB
MHGDNLFIASGILVAGFACHWLAWRVKLPSILFLLVAGIVVGPALVENQTKAEHIFNHVMSVTGAVTFSWLQPYVSICR